jgi:thiol-disulfide isomerase/thioredoxin
MHQRNARAHAVLAAIAALALAACAPAPEASTPAPRETLDQIVAPDPTSTPDPTPAPGPVVVPDHLDFTAMTLDGRSFEGASLLGQPTIIWFWAPWCPNCKAEAPAILDALDELPDGVQAIGIPGQSDVAAMQKFVDDYGLGAMPQIVDADGTLWANFLVAYQPATVLIAADGTFTTIPGSGSKDDFLAQAATIAP